jgi:2-methylisocitrate lyase-like PEP mutase family enzyme
MLRAICRVAGDTPVTADIEGGYSREAAPVAELVSSLREIGVAGINLEDGNESPELLASKINAIKHDGDIFINARVDVYLNELASGETALRETVSRAHRYEEAGADGLFVPGLSDPDEIRAVAAQTKLPLSIMAVPGLPSLTALYELGVRRVSAGPAITKLALGTAKRAAVEFVQGENVDALFSQNAVGFDEMNSIFSAA